MTFSSFSVRIFTLCFIFYFKILLFVVMRENYFAEKVSEPKNCKLIQMAYFGNDSIPFCTDKIDNVSS